MQEIIVILSPEPWGKMMLSKMHFAIELVKRGYKVFFVNPPTTLENKGLAAVREELEDGNLVVIDIGSTRGSLFLRHKLFPLFKWLNRRYSRAIKKITGDRIDQVWCFNPNVFVDLRSFAARRSILFLYDLYSGKHVWAAANSADAMVSISRVILDHYQKTILPKLQIQHGLGKHFADKASAKLEGGLFKPAETGRIRVGYTGNLLRAGMNTAVAKQIIGSHHDIEFHFWGPFSMKDNNVNAVGVGVLPEQQSLIEFLHRQPNVFLHGVVGQQELSENLFAMDMFLFMYSPKREVNGASNAHKLLEYLSTGKTVVSTHVSNYASTGLLVMCDPADEDRLPEVFEKAVHDLSLYNSEERQTQRIRFALDNTYSRQIDRILQFVG